MPRTFVEFIEGLNNRIGVKFPASLRGLDEIETARRFLEKLNEYFFQSYDGIGTTTFAGEELQYFSEFHRFWESHYREIIDVSFDEAQIREAAGALAAALRKYGPEILGVRADTKGLPPEAVANVRFFTANQDFRQPPENPFQRYMEDHVQFDPQSIAEDPEAFLAFIDVGKLSQMDKRIDFAKNAASFLLDNSITAFEIAQYFQHNAKAIRDGLVTIPNAGYGLKKANMFVRDMVVLGVWLDLRDLESIDVASDINTMKLALRTRILRTEMPLLSSFLDVFCHQYGLIDESNADAWRRVWRELSAMPDGSLAPSPCSLDSLLYNIGRDYCKDFVVEYGCSRRHSFYYFGARLTLCPVCRREGQRVEADVKRRWLPCQVEPKALPREEGRIRLDARNLLSRFDGVCIFEEVCRPKAPDFCVLDPPRSISIKGQTGWTQSRSYRDRGGGGMMA